MALPRKVAEFFAAIPKNLLLQTEICGCVLLAVNIVTPGCFVGYGWAR